MNRKQGIAVTALLVSVLIGVVSVRGALPSSSSQLLTTGIDIDLLNVVPALTYQPACCGLVVATGVGLTSGFEGGSVNATVGFSFAPVNGFSAVKSVLLTIVYLGGTGGYNGFGVELNGNSPTVISTTTLRNTAVGPLSSQDLHIGGNILNIGLNPDGSSPTGSTYLYQARLTVEYTYDTHA